MEDYGTVVKLLSGSVIYWNVQSAYKGVGTIYVRWSFGYEYPDRNMTTADIEVQEAWKKNGEREPKEFNSRIHWQQYSYGEWMSIVSD